MNRGFPLALVTALTFAASALAAEFAIDPVHSTLGFSVRHLGVSNVRGQFDKFAGTIHFDPADLSTLKAAVTIEAASVNTGNERRDNHLRNPDFFDAARYPQITFTSVEVKNINGSHFQLVGDLTMHGVSRRVTLDCELGGTTQAFGNTVAGFSATTTLNREDFGITGGGAGVAVGKEIKVLLDVEAIARK